MKSEGEKLEGGASPEQALNHPTGADTQEGLPSQASASSNAAPAEAKEESNQEPPTTAQAGEGQPPEAKAWESRKREVFSPNRQPGKAQGKGEFLLERRTPAQRYVDDDTLQRQRNRPGKKAGNRLFPRQPKGSHPANRAANPACGHEEWEGWQLVRRVVLQLVGGLPTRPTPQEGIPPKPVQSLPVEEQAQSPRQT